MIGLGNSSLAGFLINDKLRLIRAIYERDEPTRQANREHFKTLDPNIKVGDQVVVPAPQNQRHGFTIVKVTDVDVPVDFDLREDVRWIVQRVEFQPYSVVIQQEAEAMAKIREVETEARKAQLRKAMFGSSADDMKALSFAQAKPQA